MSGIKKSGDIVVTKNMLDETRNELKSDIASLKLETKSGFQMIDSRFQGVEARFDELKSEIKTLTATVHRSLALYEEQEARNKYVLDGHQVLTDRQERVEEKYDKEISDIIEEQYQRAIKLLEENKDKLTELAEVLLDKEVIFKDNLEKIFGKRPFEKEIVLSEEEE